MLALMCLAPIFFLHPYGSAFLKMVRARSWVPTPCTISSIKSINSIRVTRSRFSGTHRSPVCKIQVTYAYQFQHTSYSACRYDFVDSYALGYDSQKEFVDQHPDGSLNTCYVNPSHPDEAVLKRGFTSNWLRSLLFATILAGVVFMLVGELRRTARNRPAKEPAK